MTESFEYRTKRFRKNFKKFSVFFLICFIVVFVLIVLNIADLFSTAITNKGSLLYGEKIRITNMIYYGVSVFNSNTEENTKDAARQVSKQGGAGFVLNMGDYYVLSSIYPSHESALEVKENLEKSGVEARIININAPVININYKGNKLKENEEIFSSFNNLFLSLYDISLEYDLGNKTAVDVKKEISSLSTSFSQKITDFSAIYEKEKNTFQKVLLDALNKAKLKIDTLLTVETMELKLNSEIKKCYCEIVFDYYMLAKTI